MLIFFNITVNIFEFPRTLVRLSDRFQTLLLHSVKDVSIHESLNVGERLNPPDSRRRRSVWLYAEDGVSSREQECRT